MGPFDYHYGLMTFPRITFSFLCIFCVFLFFSAKLSSLDSTRPFELDPLFYYHYPRHIWILCFLATIRYSGPFLVFWVFIVHLCLLFFASRNGISCLPRSWFFKNLFYGYVTVHIKYLITLNIQRFDTELPVQPMYVCAFAILSFLRRDWGSFYF